MNAMKAQASKTEAEERTLEIFEEPEWKAWATVKVQGKVSKTGRVILGDMLYLSYRGMFQNV
jgi:hypothetical protein